MGLFGLMFLILFGLKLAGIITISWLLVCAPLIAVALIWCFVALFVVCVALFD